MKICGLQKLTLLDYPGRVACTVFLAGCNFRCPYCHNASLASGDESEEISQTELFSFLSRRRGILDGVAISGGEPTLSPGLDELCGKIKGMGFLVKLDTNGTKREVLERLISGGLVDFIAMDIKNTPEKYAATAGLLCDTSESYTSGAAAKSVSAEDIFQTAEYIMRCGEAGMIEYEFRTTAVREYHTKEDIAAIAKRLSGARAYYIQQYEDSGATFSGGLHAFSAAETEELAAAARLYIKNAAARGAGDGK